MKERIAELQDPRYTLISDFQERRAVLERIGLERELNHWPHLFVWAEDGVMIEVWGCHFDELFEDDPVVLLFPQEPLEAPPDDPGEWVEWRDLEGPELPAEA